MDEGCGFDFLGGTERRGKLRMKDILRTDCRWRVRLCYASSLSKELEQ